MHKEIEPYFAIADMIYDVFGDRCEVIVHDFENLDQSLIYMKGNITKRKEGAPPTNYILKELRMYGDNPPGRNAFITKNKTGNIFKTSYVYIREKESKKIIGYIGIILDVTEFLMMNSFIKSIISEDDLIDFNTTIQEEYPQNIEDIFNQIIDDTVKDFGIEESNSLDKAKKLDFVRALDERGIFMMSKSIEQISELLNVSKQTIYNYIDEIRRENTI